MFLEGQQPLLQEICTKPKWENAQAIPNNAGNLQQLVDKHKPIVQEICTMFLLGSDPNCRKSAPSPHGQMVN